MCFATYTPWVDMEKLQRESAKKMLIPGDEEIPAYVSREATC